MADYYERTLGGTNWVGITNLASNETSYIIRNPGIYDLNYVVSALSPSNDAIGIPVPKDAGSRIIVDAGQYLWAKRVNNYEQGLICIQPQTYNVTSGIGVNSVGVQAVDFSHEKPELQEYSVEQLTNMAYAAGRAQGKLEEANNLNQQLMQELAVEQDKRKQDQIEANEFVLQRIAKVEGEAKQIIADAAVKAHTVSQEIIDEKVNEALMDVPNGDMVVTIRKLESENESLKEELNKR